MTNTKKEQIEVIVGTEKRRRWSAGEKKAIVDETYRPGMSVSSVARKYGIAPNQLFYWRRRMEEGALTAVGSEEKVIPDSEAKALRARIKQLEQVLGKVTLENEILKEGLKIAREKKLISRQPLPGLEDLE